MITLQRAFLLLGLSTLVASCSLEVEPLSLIVAGLSSERPSTSIGASEGSGPWRRLVVTLERSDVDRIHQWQSTLHFRITDCAGDFLTVEDTYVNGVSLNTVRFMSGDEYQKFADALSDVFQADIFLEERIYQSEAKICGTYKGGSVLGMKIQEKNYDIKG